MFGVMLERHDRQLPVVNKASAYADRACAAKLSSIRATRSFPTAQTNRLLRLRRLWREIHDALTRAGVVNWLTGLSTPSLSPLLCVEVTL